MARVICQLFFTCSSRSLVPVNKPPTSLLLQSKKQYYSIFYNFNKTNKQQQNSHSFTTSIRKMSAEVVVVPVLKEENEEVNKSDALPNNNTSNSNEINILESASNGSSIASSSPSLASVENSEIESNKSDSLSSSSDISNNVPTSSTSTTETTSKGDENVKDAFLRYRKRKIVLMMSYCGHNYFGMQKNIGMKTIEGELFTSLLKNNYVDEETCKKPQTAQFQRAARTDKHVSAARQIVSFKGPEEVDIDKINEFLPPEIRVMGLKRVTRGFDAKNNCDARTYMYMIPTFAFTPIEIPVKEDYRIPTERVAEVQKTLNLYLGAKNYHNFTSRKRPNDPSARRMIYSFNVEPPFVKDGLEYCILKVKGQSFMLHQIRKMIGLVVAYMRGFATLETFQKCWGSDRIDIPKAPGVGLMLDFVHYTRYDQKFGTDGMHDKLTWDSQEDKVQEFCDQYIYPIITKTENEQKSMMDWLSTIPFHTYDVREAGPPPTDIEEIQKHKFEGDYGTSPIGKAFYAVGKVQGELPHFSKKAHEKDNEDDEEDEDVKPKKARLEVSN